MSGWWIKDLYDAGETVRLTATIFWVIFSICLHELAHGWTAIWQGDNTPRELGHMTMNPMVHMGPFSLIVFALTGWAWGLMPVNPSRFRSGHWGNMLVSAAGPAMNLLIAFVALTVLALWVSFADSSNQPFYDNVSEFMFYGGAINIGLALLNLLPFPPLDGASVLAGFSRSFRNLINQPQAPIIGMILFLVVVRTPIGDAIWNAGGIAANTYARALINLLP